ARRPAPPTTATHMTLITLRPPETRGDVPDSVARGGADTSQTRDHGRKARRARTPTRAPRPHDGRWRRRRRGPGPANRRARRSAAEEWLAPGGLVQQIEELGEDAGGRAPDQVVGRDLIELHGMRLSVPLPDLGAEDGRVPQ